VSAVAAACGVNKEELRRAVSLPIYGYTKMRDHPEGGAGIPVVYVAVDTAGNASIYAHSLHIQVLAYVPVALPWQPWQQFVSMKSVEVWSNGTVAVSSISFSKAQVNRIAEEIARKLAADWQVANP
jgi:hypothetical protein